MPRRATRAATVRPAASETPRTVKLADLRPGWRSDFILHRFSALIDERDDCIVVRTPDNPGYYWGNFVLLPQAPQNDDLARWLGRFEREVVLRQPVCKHVAIGVNAVPADEQLPAWFAAGFERIETAIIEQHAGELRAPTKPARGRFELRQLDLITELEAVVALQCTDMHGFEPQGYAEHRRQQMRRYAAMAQQGLAAWFGLWCDGVLAADCGLMRDGKQAGATGRFQRVVTDPAYRRRGLCSALVHGVTAWGFEHWGLGRILMCADPHDVALGIYESLGYRRIDSEWCLQRKAPQDRGAAA